MAASANTSRTEEESPCSVEQGSDSIPNLVAAYAKTLPMGSGHIRVTFLGIVESRTALGPVLHLVLYSLYIDIGSKDRPELEFLNSLWGLGTE